ncbi:Methyltransferase domain-containing protein [Glycomyces sambucus]|uniref:Methyltransferase domain-containing protein n=2 Tax=Glycomyces sambucus TaxID=380244 RepID=A0A1G9HZE5_9ACTN|nr:Methyltransferase domain-containing protein [Glycomyces sambucus]
MRQNWTDGAAGWVANQAVFDAVFAPVTAAILAAAALERGSRVLDVGCGTGTLLAAAVAAGAEPVGVDISEGMAAAARERVPEAGVLVADAQTADLRGDGPAFDRVVSRFGVMFFEDPRAAFANLRRAAAPGARLVFACWRGLDENPMFSLGSGLLADRLDPRPEPSAPGAPGPDAFADPERLHKLLDGAGWDGIRIDPLDFTCDYGFDGTDGVEERLTQIRAGGVGRLAEAQLVPRIGTDGWEAVLDEVRRELRGRLVDGVLRFPGAVWLVSAANAAANPAAGPAANAA